MEVAVGMNNEFTNNELLQRESRAGLCNENALDQWAKTLSSIIADPTAAERLGSAGRQIVTTHYSVAALVPCLVKLLHRLLG
jgi:glycosyltransferase involved in cell wall biosynthesis